MFMNISWLQAKKFTLIPKHTVDLVSTVWEHWKQWNDKLNHAQSRPNTPWKPEGKQYKKCYFVQNRPC